VSRTDQKSVDYSILVSNGLAFAFPHLSSLFFFSFFSYLFYFYHRTIISQCLVERWWGENSRYPVVWLSTIKLILM